jgi:hypothetical protein
MAADQFRPMDRAFIYCAPEQMLLCTILNESVETCSDCGNPVYLCRTEAGNLIDICSSALRHPV